MRWESIQRRATDAVIKIFVCVAITWLALPSEARADYSQSEKWFNSHSEVERRSLQEALFWAGHYTDPLDGQFDSQVYASLVAFQSRFHGSPTGVLTPVQASELEREADRVRELVRYFTGKAPSDLAWNSGCIRGCPTTSWLLILP